MQIEVTESLINTSETKIVDAASPLFVLKEIRASLLYGYRTEAELGAESRSKAGCTFKHSKTLLLLFRHLIDPRGTMEAMLKSKVLSYPPHIQAVYVQNTGKLYSKVISKAEAEDDLATVKTVGRMLRDRLPMFVGSSDLEVQERVKLHFVTREIISWNVVCRHLRSYM